MMAGEITLLEAINRADRMILDLEDEAKEDLDPIVATQIERDRNAIINLQEAAWVILLGKTGGMKVV